MSFVLIPSSFPAVAAKIGLNLHPAVFLFGPALYFLGNDLLPGTDYYSQYSIGLPWLFHFVMGNSAERAVLNYTTIVILATWLFYAHLIRLLQWLYRSWTAATVVAFMPLILGFHFPVAFQAYFFAPSSSVLRYPLLTLCAMLTGLWAEAPARPTRLLPIATATAASIFLETESGIIVMLAAPMTIFLIHPWRPSIIMPIVAFVATTAVVLLVALFAVLGPGAMQPEFFHRLFDGVLIFGASGFGAWPMIWTLSEWNWFYHIVAPTISLATIAVIARACGNVAVDRRRTAVLAFLATSGLMLLLKYANESITAVWQMSAVGPLSVLGWWCVALLRHIDPCSMRHQGFVGLRHGAPVRLTFREIGQITFPPRRSLAAAMMLTLALIFLYSPSESRNPGRYGFLAWGGYPSLLRWPFSRPEGCIRMDCVPNLPAASDVAVITSRTQPGEQVAIVGDLYDWTYLLAAHRPPLMFFLPSSMIFTEQQLEESLGRLSNQNYLFVPKGPNAEPFSISPDDLRDAVGPLLGTIFQRGGVGDRLVVWKRVAPKGVNGAR